MKKIVLLRYGIIGLLFWLILGSGILLFYSIFVKKFDVSVGSLAVIASTVSAIFAYELIHKDRINQLPHIIIDFDDQSRFQFFQLVVKNVGGSTAFNVQVKWLSRSPDGVREYSIPKGIKDNRLVAIGI